MDIQLFRNEQFGQLRGMNIEGEPWFVGKDVAQVLGYSNSPKAIRDHVDDEDKRSERIVHPLGGVQQTTFINESGLYALILSSKLPKAREFKRWVTAEVLPQIRKTGGYIVHLPFTDLQCTIRPNYSLAKRKCNRLSDCSPKHHSENAMRKGGGFSWFQFQFYFLQDAWRKGLVSCSAGVDSRRFYLSLQPKASRPKQSYKSNKPYIFYVPRKQEYEL